MLDLDPIRMGTSTTLTGAGVSVHVLGDEPPVLFAGQQVAFYLPRLLGDVGVDVFVGHPDRSLAAAGLPARTLPQDDSIIIEGNGSRYVAGGGTPAATLHAAYTLLEALGARWTRPGSAWEVLSPLEGALPPISVVSTPAFRDRGIVESCLSWWPEGAPFEEWLAETFALVDWMGKMRLNRLFVHFNRLPRGDISPLLPELEKRGIALELGGHALPKLIPSDVREREPDLCRVFEGQRRLDANFCTSNPRTLDWIKEGASRYVDALPPADVYHFWTYDAKEDPWCSCQDCSGLSHAEQMWRAVSAAADGAAAVRPGARFSGLLYHESIEAATTAPDWALTTFAPRERCYQHSIGGPCARNLKYASQLRAALPTLGDRLTVLEYYGDPILLGRPANRSQMVVGDLRHYREEGVSSISTLTFGALSSWLYPVQLYTYAKAAWDPEGAATADEQYALAVCPGHEGTALEYLRLMEEAAGTHLRFCGYGSDGSWVTLPFPPPEPHPEVVEHLAELRRGDDLIKKASDLLSSISGHLGTTTLGRAHSLEEAFHKAVLVEVEASLGISGHQLNQPFGLAAEVLAQAGPALRGVFGTHWMLPWLRRCAEAGRAVSV